MTKNRLDRASPWVLTVCAWALAVAFMAYNFNRPLSFHQEDAPAHVLVTLQGMSALPWSVHKGLPVFTMPNKESVHIRNLAAASLRDRKGYCFYTSWPVLGFLVPHLVFAVLHVEPTLPALQCFNLGLGLVSLLLLGKLLERACPSLERWQRAAIVCLCAFTPNFLWNFQNAYWGTSLFLPPYLIVCLMLLRPLATWRQALGLGGVLMICNGIDWTGYLICFSLCVSAAVEVVRQRRISAENVRMMTTAVLTVLVSVAVQLWHFSRISGLHDYLGALAKRFDARHTVRGSEVLAGVSFNFVYGLLPVLVFAILALGYRYWRKSPAPSAPSSLPLHLIGAVSLPPLLDMFGLAGQAYLYDFVLLKWVPLLALVLARFMSGLTAERGTVLTTARACVFVGLVLYVIQNPPQNLQMASVKGWDQVFHDTGEVIRRTTAPGDLTFVNGPSRGELVYYAGRNLWPDVKPKDVLEELTSLHAETGKVYFFDGLLPHPTPLAQLLDRPIQLIGARIVCMATVTQSTGIASMQFLDEGFCPGGAGCILDGKLSIGADRMLLSWLKPGSVVTFPGGPATVTGSETKGGNEYLVFDHKIAPGKDGGPVCGSCQVSLPALLAIPGR